jgi:hypothetical protein
MKVLAESIRHKVFFWKHLRGFRAVLDKFPECLVGQLLRQSLRTSGKTREAEQDDNERYRTTKFSHEPSADGNDGTRLLTDPTQVG